MRWDSLEIQGDGVEGLVSDEVRKIMKARGSRPHEYAGTRAKENTMVRKKKVIEKMMELERENNVTVRIVMPTRRFHDQA